MTAFSRRAWSSEIIVCDNNSTDRTAELSRAAGARVVFEPVNQIARARNCGAAAATGDWLMFIDADSHPSAELLAEVAEQIQTGRCLAGGCTIRVEGGNWWGPSQAAVERHQPRRPANGQVVSIFCKADAFREVGGSAMSCGRGDRP